MHNELNRKKRKNEKFLTKNKSVVHQNSCVSTANYSKLAFVLLCTVFSGHSYAYLNPVDGVITTVLGDPCYSAVGSGDLSVINNGEINVPNDAAIYATADNAEVINAGSITSIYAVTLDGNNQNFVNTSTGIITTTTFNTIISAYRTGITITNNGLIQNTIDFGPNPLSSKLKCNTNPEVLCCDEYQIQTS